MAEGKKSFTAYCDWIETFESLEDEDAGKLAKHLFRYVNDLNPTAEDTLTKVAFAQIKMTLKRDLKKWENKKDERSKSGILGNLKRYQKDLYEAVVSDKITIEEAQKVAKGRTAIHSDTKLADSVSVSVSVSDSVSDNVSTDVDDVYANPDKFFDTEKLSAAYLKNLKIVRAVTSNTKNGLNIKSLKTRLKEFNQHLNEQGVGVKSFADYTHHFLAWHKKNKKINTIEKQNFL
jgi:hypothetical protein